MFFKEVYASNDTISIEDSETVPQTSEHTHSGWMSMLPMILIFLVFYFLLIRPQEKRRRQKEALVSGVKIGDTVLTSGGIFGVITAVNDSDHTVVLEIAKDIQIKILKKAITDITSCTQEGKNKKNKQDKRISGGKSF